MMRSFSERLLPALLILPFLVLGVASARGQGIGQAPATGAQQNIPTAENVSDQEIQAIAQAFVAIQKLQQQYRQEHGNINTLDSAAARKVQRQFQQELRQLLQDQENVTPFRFQQVMQTARQDTALRQRLTGAIQEQGGQLMGPAAAAGAPRSGSGRAAPNVSSDQVQSAARAYVAIQEVKSHYRETQDADPEESGAQELGREIVETIEEHDLTRETFKQVMLGARRSPQLRTQLLSAIDQAQQAG